MYKTYVFARHSESVNKAIYLMDEDGFRRDKNGIPSSNWNIDINRAGCIDDIRKAKKLQEIWQDGFILEIDFIRTKKK